VYKISSGGSGAGGSGDGDSLDATPPPPHPTSKDEKIPNKIDFRITKAPP
tara:strand:+ start:452 stop:601 length:150 start_codon:yes stop_codon:yes gene_type:complete